MYDKKHLIEGGQRASSPSTDESNPPRGHAQKTKLPNTAVSLNHEELNLDTRQGQPRPTRRRYGCKTRPRNRANLSHSCTSMHASYTVCIQPSGCLSRYIDTIRQRQQQHTYIPQTWMLQNSTEKLAECWCWLEWRATPLRSPYTRKTDPTSASVACAGRLCTTRLPSL